MKREGGGIAGDNDVDGLLRHTTHDASRWEQYYWRVSEYVSVMNLHIYIYIIFVVRLTIFSSLESGSILSDSMTC